MFHKCHFGWDRFFISISLLSVSILNILLQYIKTGNILDRPYLTLLLIILSIIIYVIGTKSIISIILLILGIITLIDSPNISDLTAALLFIFSYQLLKNIKYGIFVLSLNVIAIAFKATYKSMSIYQSFILLLGFSSIYILYYFIIFKNCTPKVKLSDLTKQENQILSDIAAGKTQKEIASNMKISTNKVNDILKSVRKKTGISSLYQLMYEISDL